MDRQTFISNTTNLGEKPWAVEERLHTPLQLKENPYDDAWIYDRFDTGNQRFTELEDFMNQRQTALATPKYYDLGGGMSVKQDNLGQYFAGQLQSQADAFNQRLDEMAAASQQSRQQMEASMIID